MKKGIIAIVVIVVLILIYGFTTYNGLVTLSENSDTAWQQVEVNYQRRFDLIPNLVESVKGVMKQETAIFTAIAEARTRYSGATTPDEKALAAGQVESAFGRLLVVMENYPQLKSSENVTNLMSQIEGTENRIGVARMDFNNTVRDYNLKVKRIPSSIVASLTGFLERAYFESEAGSEKAPEVKF